MPDERLLTVRQVADRLQITRVTVQRWLRSGRLHGIRLPADKIGWRIRESEVQRVIAEATKAGTVGLPDDDYAPAPEAH